MYKLLKQIDGVSHSEILERMEALEALHNQGGDLKWIKPWVSQFVPIDVAF